MINFRSTLRNYASKDHTNKNKRKNDKSLTNNREEENFNSKQAKTFTKYLFNISNIKIQGFTTHLVPPLQLHYLLLDLKMKV